MTPCDGFSIAVLQCEAESDRRHYLERCTVAFAQKPFSPNQFIGRRAWASKQFEASKAEGARTIALRGWRATGKALTSCGSSPAIWPASPRRPGASAASLGGRFLLHEYETQMNGEPFSGVAIYGHHMDGGTWESAWGRELPYRHPDDVFRRAPIAQTGFSRARQLRRRPGRSALGLAHRNRTARRRHAGHRHDQYHAATATRRRLSRRATHACADVL